MNSSHHAENHNFDEAQIDRTAELAREFDRESSELFAVLFGPRSGPRHGASLPHLPGSGTGCSPHSVSDGYITVTVAVHVPIFIPILNNLLASTPGGSYRTMSDTVTVRVEPCTLTNGS